MKNLKEGSYTAVNTDELKSINGGTKYYGNGVYCNSKKCWVDWGQASGCIGQTVVGGWLGGAIPGKC
ncbi:class II bacteriocin [Carnobacterium divergens]|uniref:Divercin V41 n=1 Tax=Carnobacterium divergens TaxID=2748 RepID=Q9Z4J1_CARDV|nr:class II bacteriocin [Carnobacterium divergens]CAA11804.1 divercin V41 [Carnobacterium divergens]SBO16636.1 Divercin V41, class IIa bacteriocin [Carnobacterium divergens]